LESSFCLVNALILSHRGSEKSGKGGVGEGEAGFPGSGEPDAGLDPRALGS